jgi:hypothetical protein
MEPSWKKLKLVKVEARSVGPWSLAIDYIPGLRLLRFKVIPKDEQGRSVPTSWSPSNNTECGADGITIATSTSGLLCNGAMYGALIAKVGGSSADLPDSSSATLPYGNKRVFAVGSYCVVLIGSSEGGPLFLTMNDKPDGCADHSGALHVLIEECLM